MMVSLGVAITLLMKKWADAHSLAVKEKVAKYISGNNGMSIKIVGMTSMTLLMAPTLEPDISNVAVCLGLPRFWDVICCSGTIRHLAWPLSPCLGLTNKLLLAGHRRRWAVLRLPI